MPEAPRSVHIAGISGMGNAPLALYLKDADWEVRGWDDRPNPRVEALLNERGIPTRECALSDDVELFAYSSAVKAVHPLRREADRRNLTALPRGELLARVSRQQRLLAVVGSHGKTTTAGLLIHFLEAAGVDFSYILGGLFQDAARAPARYSPTAQWLIAEVDESDGTIEAFAPEITLAVNLDWDHPDRYADFSQLEETFGALFRRTTGTVLYPSEGTLLTKLAASASVRSHSFGTGGEYAATPRLDDPHSAQLNGRFPSERIALPRADGFFLKNATAALAAAHCVASDLNAGALESFSGIHRRQELLLQSEGLTVATDYAHHPTEIRALLRHYRQLHRGQLWAVFQPHRFTRTQQYAADFAQVLAEGADRVFLLPVYAAGELPLTMGTREAIRASWPAQAEAPSLALEGNELASQLRHALMDTGEVTVLFIGAGDIDTMARQFAASPPLDAPTAATRSRPAFVESVIRAGLPPDCLRRDEPMADKTTWRVGGPAAFYAEPTNANEASLLIRTAHDCELPVFVLGRGSNLLVPDRGFSGLVLRLAGSPWQLCRLREDGKIEAGGGLRLKQLCAEAAKLGLDGFGYLEGIPGTIGGALQMNAGAMGGWIFDRVESVRFLDQAGQLREAPAVDFTPGYRVCPELEGCLVLSAVFAHGMAAETVDLRRQMDTYAQKRRATQPREPSAGSTFRNPLGAYAGQLIEEAGLKGTAIGGAQISELHANFIINTGGASAADIMALMRFTRHRVEAFSGIRLVPEVVLVGRDWEEVLA